MHLLVKALLFCTLATALTLPAKAQDTPAAEKPVCETMEAFNDWNFWVGDWKVYSNDDKHRFQGNNVISKHHNNCLIMENWTSASGGQGSSMNYYDAVDKQWRQLWISNGYSIDYTGGLDKNGAMVLNGKINYYTQDKSFQFRGSWTPNDDGTVRQLFEQFNKDKDQWTVWFDGIYERK